MKNKTNSNTNKEEVKINVDKHKVDHKYNVAYSIPVEGEKKQLVILLDPSTAMDHCPNISFANMNDQKFNTTDLLIGNDLLQADDKVKSQEEDLKSKYKNYVFVDTPESIEKSEYTHKLKEKRGTIDTKEYKNVKILVTQHGSSPYMPYKDILQQLKSTNNLNSLYVSDSGCHGRDNIKELYDYMSEKSKSENGIFLFSTAKNDHNVNSYAKHTINRLPLYKNELVVPIIKKIIGEGTLKELYNLVKIFSMLGTSYTRSYDDNDKKPLNRMLEKYNINDGVLKEILKQYVEQNIKNEKHIFCQQSIDDAYMALGYDGLLEKQKNTFLVSIYNYIRQNNKITFEEFLKGLRGYEKEFPIRAFERANNILAAKAMFDFNLLDEIFEKRVKQINEDLPKDIKDIKINKEQLNEILSVFVGNKIEKTLSDTINNYYWFFKGNMYKIPHSCIEKRRNAKEFYQEILNNIKNLEKIAGNEVEVEKAVTEDFNNFKETNYIKWNKLEEEEKKDLLEQIRIAIFKLTLEGKLEEKESKDLLEQVESARKIALKGTLEGRSELRNETRMKKNEKFIERTDKSILKASQSKANLLHFTRYGGNMFDKKMLKKNYKKQNIPYLKPKSILQQTLYTINKEEKKNLIDK